MQKRIRRKEGENLDNATISKVVALLEQVDNPISKKEACETLNISYNVKRLDTIVENWREEKERKRQRRLALRNVPVSKDEAKEIVNSYLSGEAVVNILDFSNRSLAAVKEVLNQYNIPERSRGEVNYFSPPFIPDSGITENYVKGDLVYAARYGAPATIEKLVKEDKFHGNIYRIWVHGDYACYALQPYYELGDLRKAQRELDLKVEDLSVEEIRRLLYEAYIKSKKGKKVDE